MNYAVKDALLLAKKNNGKFLSEQDKLIKTNSLCLWECSENHQFNRTVTQILNNNWCDICTIISGSKGERLCNSIFKVVFKSNFFKVSPEWLKTDLGNFLELDGYSEELGIAFEYQGEQHYRFIKKFHSDEKDFLNQQLRDKIKVEKCKEMGVKLFIINDKQRIKIKDIINQIKAQLPILNIEETNLILDLDKINKNIVIKNPKLKKIKIPVKKTKKIKIQAPKRYIFINNRDEDKVEEYIKNEAKRLLDNSKK